MTAPLFHRMNKCAKRTHVVSLWKKPPDRQNVRVDHETFLLRQRLRAEKARFQMLVVHREGKVLDVMLASPGFSSVGAFPR